MTKRISFGERSSASEIARKVFSGAIATKNISQSERQRLADCMEQSAEMYRRLAADPVKAAAIAAILAGDAE